jgi:hypothetical protein
VTAGDVVNALTAGGNAGASVWVLLDGVAHQVRAVTHTSFETSPAAPAGVALLRLEKVNDAWQLAKQVLS